MSLPLEERRGVWFLYDGACPMCSAVAVALRIREEYGELHLLDARQNRNDALYIEATRRGLDLDEGVVIYVDGRFHHGAEVLTFMSRFGDPGNAMMGVSKLAFRWRPLAELIYPWLRAGRNRLIRRRGVAPIDNLDLGEEPVFKPIFGAAWAELPPVFHKHYANRPYSSDLTVVEGVMDVSSAGPMRLLAPLLNALRQIPARNEKGVPVRVEYRSQPDMRAFHFRRVFRFEGGRTYEFRSRMVGEGGANVVETMRFGLCWRLRYGWDGEKVTLDHRGYGLRLFGRLLPLPLGLLIGESRAEERAVDENRFDMATTITHPWWGRVYEYKGRFTVVDVPDITSS